MNLQQLLQTKNLEHTVLIGYYGGGNYGDELLLEVLANLLKAKDVQDVTITHQDPKNYSAFHHDFGYKLVEMHDKPKTFRAILKNKNIIIGGGGLWGLDVNPNILLLSTLLFISRWIFGKKVYLIGVGYYNSTNRLGRVSAWLAGKAATYIIARDSETLQNFSAISKHVGLDKDMAWQIPAIDLKPYEPDFAALNKTLPVREKTMYVTLRRFRANNKNNYTQLVEECLKNNPDKQFIVALLEPKKVDPEGHKIAAAWAESFKNVRITDYSYNPLALFLYFRENQDKLALIGPQFHIIITAHLSKVPFLPIVYDNKVAELLKLIGQKQPVPIKELSQSHVQDFVDDFYGKRKK